MSEKKPKGAMRHWKRTTAVLHDGSKSYGRILSYVRPYWGHLVLVAFSMVAISLLTLALPWAIEGLVDVVVVEQDTVQLNRIALALAAIFILRAILGFLQSYLSAWVGERVVAQMRREIYEHLLSLSLGFFSGQRVGGLVSRVSSDVLVIQSAVTSNLVRLLQQTVTVIGVIVIVALMSWRLALLMVISVPVMVLITRLMGRRIRQVAKLVQDTLAEAAAVVEETVGGIRIVKSFAREPHEAARFGAKVETLFDAAMYRTKIYAVLGPLISLLMYGSLILVLWVGAQEVLRGRLTAGQLVAFVFYAIMLVGPLSGFAGLYGQIQAAIGATERVFELLDTQSEIVELPDAQPLPPISGHVTFHQVSFDYDPRQPVLRDVNLEARHGQVVALVGPSGVGKTTLVNLIPRFYDPTAGEITIDGNDVRHVSLRSLRKQIGIVPQETQLFSDTVEANIRYGKLDATRSEIETAAQAANAHDFITGLPDGYATQVGERGIKLSGGQRQRVAIARAILKDPRILILDEATSSLDTESERLVQDALERLMRPSEQEGQGRTTFVIAHRLSTIINADQIIVLHEGQIVEHGTHQELLDRPDGFYRHYHALQFQWGQDDVQQDDRRLDLPAPEITEWQDLRAPFLPPSVLSGQDEE